MVRPRKNTSRLSAEASPPRVDAMTLLALALLVVALMLSFASWQKLGFIMERFDDRLDRLESRVSQAVSSATTEPTQPAQPRRRGPDPERIYDIDTAGAPVKGPADAPVTIAEFSDFQ